MKCEYCGNNLGIEDAVCPYCGKENKFAKKHNKDMRKYSAAFDSTREEVISNSKRFNSLTVRITVIAVLAALIAIMFVLLSNNYEIRSAREEKIVAKNAGMYRKELDRLMDENDYLTLYYYMQSNRISYSDSLEEYYMVYNACHTYHTFMDYMNYLIDENTHMTDEEAIESISEIIDRMYTYANPTSEYEIKKYYSDRNMEFINGVLDHMTTIVKGYFNLSDEEMDSFATLSKAKKQLLLEEGYSRVK